MKLIEREEFPQILLQFLTSHSMTQRELARRLGVPNETVNGWIKGRAMPKYDRLKQLLEMMEDEGTD